MGAPLEHSLARQSAWSRFGPWLAGFYLICALLFVQWGARGLPERDGYYHARFANLLPEYGVSRHFHWTQASTWKDQYCDKEFLYHVFLAPFARNASDPVSGVRFAALILSCAVFGALFWILKKNGARWPVFFALLPLGMGGPFLLRVLMIRSHVLSIVLLLLGLHFLLQRRWRWLLALGFIYAWSYTVPLALVLTAIPFVAGAWLKARSQTLAPGQTPAGFDWKSPAAALAGVVLGLAIHPYSPQTLETFLTLVQVMEIGSHRTQTALELGGEIYAFRPVDFLRLLPLYYLSLLAAAGLAAHSWRKMRAGSVGALCAALFWFGMSLFYGRFIEYGAPAVALALGLLASDAEILAPAASRRAGLYARAMAVMLLCFGQISTLAFAHRDTLAADPPRFRGAAAWMAANLKPGETVAHLWWEEFPDLFYAAYRQNFVWGLDPTFTLRYNPAIAQRLEDMRLKRVPLNPHWLARTLHARVLAMGHAQALRYPELTCGQWNPVYADRSAVIFALTGPHGPPETFKLPARLEPLPAFAPCSLPLN